MAAKILLFCIGPILTRRLTALRTCDDDKANDGENDAGGDEFPIGVAGGGFSDLLHDEDGSAVGAQDEEEEA
jgi:hypothetical protein